VIRFVFHSVSGSAARHRLRRRGGQEPKNGLSTIRPIGADASSPSRIFAAGAKARRPCRMHSQAQLYPRVGMFAPDDAFLLILRLAAVPAGLIRVRATGGRGSQGPGVRGTTLRRRITEVVATEPKAIPYLRNEGPRVYSTRRLLRTVARRAGLRPGDADALCFSRRVRCGSAGNPDAATPHPQSGRTMQIDTRPRCEPAGIFTHSAFPRSLEEN